MLNSENWNFGENPAPEPDKETSMVREINLPAPPNHRGLIIGAIMGVSLVAAFAAPAAAAKLNDVINHWGYQIRSIPSSFIPGVYIG